MHIFSFSFPLFSALVFHKKSAAMRPMAAYRVPEYSRVDAAPVNAEGAADVEAEVASATTDVGCSGCPSLASVTTAAELVVTGAAVVDGTSVVVGASGWPSLASVTAGAELAVGA